MYMYSSKNNTYPLDLFTALFLVASTRLREGTDKWVGPEATELAAVLFLVFLSVLVTGEVREVRRSRRGATRSDEGDGGREATENERKEGGREGGREKGGERERERKAHSLDMF